MSTGAIVAIVVAAAIIILILAVLMPRMRAKQEERRLVSRRQEVAGAHRERAQDRIAEADLAEKEAQRRRAEAELHETRAEMHDRGLADDNLEQEHGRFVRGDRDDETLEDDRTTSARRDDV
jgi:predicted Holliday junction resolvase-like endonuclease